MSFLKKGLCVGLAALAFGLGIAHHSLEASQYSFEPIVKVFPSGNGIAIWQSYDDSGNFYIQSNLLTSGTWGTPTVISSTSYYTLNHLLAVDAANNAVTTWIGVDSSTGIASLYGVTYRAGSGWGTPELISDSGLDVSDGYVPQYSLHLHDTATGSVALVAWGEYDSTFSFINVFSSSIVYTTLFGWGSWSAPAQASSS